MLPEDVVPYQFSSSADGGREHFPNAVAGDARHDAATSSASICKFEDAADYFVWAYYNTPLLE